MSDDFSCDSCGAESVIFTYYNTKLDAVPSVDVFEHGWGEDKEDIIKRVDCKECNNIIWLEDDY